MGNSTLQLVVVSAGQLYGRALLRGGIMGTGGEVVNALACKASIVGSNPIPVLQPLVPAGALLVRAELTDPAGPIWPVLESPKSRLVPKAGQSVSLRPGQAQL